MKHILKQLKDRTSLCLEQYPPAVFRGPERGTGIGTTPRRLDTTPHTSQPCFPSPGALRLVCIVWPGTEGLCPQARLPAGFVVYPILSTRPLACRA